MAASYLPWTTNDLASSESGICISERNRCLVNRGIMERSSLMPRKSLDIRFTDQPVLQKRGQCALFLTSGEDRFGQSPIMGQGTSPLQVRRAAPYALGELSNTNICSFQGSFEPIFSTQFFHRLLDTTLFSISILIRSVHFAEAVFSESRCLPSRLQLLLPMQPKTSAHDP